MEFIDRVVNKVIARHCGDFSCSECVNKLKNGGCLFDNFPEIRKEYVINLIRKCSIRVYYVGKKIYIFDGSVPETHCWYHIWRYSLGKNAEIWKLNTNLEPERIGTYSDWEDRELKEGAYTIVFKNWRLP